MDITALPPNLLDQIKLTSTYIEEQISSYALSFPQDRRQDVEWGMKFPMFVLSFYSYIMKNNSIPNQQSFFDYYKTKNSAWFQSANLTTEQLEGIKARVYRSYPSLVRDIHFSLLTKESAAFDMVYYNETVDIERGIDLIIKKNASLFAANLFIQTSRAQIGRNKKQFRHTLLPDLIYIELPVEFKGSKQCGQFFLYSERELKELIVRVKKHLVA